MRKLCLPLTVLVSTFLLAPAVSAGPGGHKPKPKPKKVVAIMSGAGQRLSFSFGGKLKLRQDGSVKGKFILSAHPSSPAGNTLNVNCRFKEFSDVSITGGTATFRATGRCRRLNTDGTISSFKASNQFQIVDNPAGDQIDVNFIGSSGIAVPAGALSFGNFTFTNPN